jgi:hypothetical protein
MPPPNSTHWVALLLVLLCDCECECEEASEMGPIGWQQLNGLCERKGKKVRRRDDPCKNDPRRHSAVAGFAAADAAAACFRRRRLNDTAKTGRAIFIAFPAGR